VRVATPEDSAGILKVYGPYVVGTRWTFETEVPDADAFAERVRGVLRGYPWLVHEDGDGGAVLGYAYASPAGERAAYAHSANVSVYVDMGRRGEGIGGGLYGELLRRLEGYEIYTLYAGIALPNDASVGFHKSFGFTEAGLFHKVGFKLGEWVDLLWMERPIKDYSLKAGHAGGKPHE